VKARARVIVGFVRFGNRRNQQDAAATPAAFGDGKGTGVPAAGRAPKLALLAFAALATTLVLGVALAGAVAPVVSAPTATAVEYTTAHLAGEVNPEDHETSFHFEYITDAQYLANEGGGEPPFTGASETATKTLAENAGLTPVAADLTGLHAEATYHFRLVASNESGATSEAGASTFTTKAVAKPLVSGLAASDTHFSGMVNPNAPEAAPATAAVKAGFKTHWSFTCSFGCNFSGDSEGDLEADNSASEVSADPVNLIPNQPYEVTLHATNPGGETTETTAFTTPAIKPAVATATSTEARPTSITLNGTVNPHNSSLSDCHFLYGLGAALDQSAPCEGTLPSGEGSAAVHAQLSGLAPGTEYSFQLLATNPVGSAESGVGHFGTPTGAVATACPNEAIRIAQHATQTGECRAWERVSPADKGGDIVAEGEKIIAAEDGDGAAFDSRYGFADTEGSGGVGRTTYLAQRGAGGWSVHSITPQGRPDAVQVLRSTTHTEVFSPDLSRVRAVGYDLPGATGATPERMSMYLEDTATRALRTVSSSQRGNGEDPIQYWFNEFNSSGQNELWGASDDLLHMGWESPTQLLAADVVPGYPQGTELHQLIPQIPPYVFTVGNVYTWDDGTLHLAGILPDGSLPPGGSQVDPQAVRGTMSADGSRQTFVASPAEGAPSQLYLRIDHSRTALISESENEAFTAAAQGVGFEGMTPDGKNLFFVTESPLLEEDEAPGPDLYRWTDGPDPEHESNLTLITDNGGSFRGPSSSGGALVGMSGDGSRVYVHNVGARMELWEEGNGLKTIDPFVPRGSGKDFLDLLAYQPGLGRVSPDGNWAAYITRTKGDAKTGGTGEMRLYDRRQGTLTKVSEQVSLVPTITQGGLEYIIGFRPRFLSGDGKVFFTSGESLVPQDTNGVADVYEYDGPAGELRLVTSGKGSEPMEFADASADGEDVFFVTRAQLVPSDNDDYADLYDARTDGGFEEPQASSVKPCSGEACQAASGASASNPVIASGAAGRGNLKPGRNLRCAKNRHKVRRHGKVRCVKRHPKAKAGAKRGGAK
jgi:Tol biopolymer transport system component